MESIMQSDKTECFLCGRNGSGDPLECHHVFGGSNRDHSEEDGLKVYLCGSRCHRNGFTSAHQNKKTAGFLKAEAQLAWMNYYHKDVEDFRARYHKSYI